MEKSEKLIENLWLIRDQYSAITLEDIRAAVASQNQALTEDQNVSRDPEFEFNTVKNMLNQLDALIEIFKSKPI